MRIVYSDELKSILIIVEPWLVDNKIPPDAPDDMKELYKKMIAQANREYEAACLD